jgi:hypothetical protein
MGVFKQWARELVRRMGGRAWAMRVAWCLLAAVLSVGCDDQGNRGWAPFAGPSDGDPTLEDPPPANPETCVCTPVAPFGFDGPSLVGRGAQLTDIQCPPDASLPGFAGLVIETNQWARECRITPLPTCGASGWVCAPPVPKDFSLCIYRGEAFSCPADYHRAEAVLEADGGALSDDEAVTLCCAEDPETG